MKSEEDSIDLDSVNTDEVTTDDTIERRKSLRRSVKKVKTDDPLDTSCCIARVKFSHAEMDELISMLDEHGVLRSNTVLNRMNKQCKFLDKWMYKRANEAYDKKVKRARATAGPASKRSLATDIVADHHAKIYDLNELSALTDTLLLIAHAEEHPDPKECDGIDFKELYEALFMACQGYPWPRLSDPTNNFLRDCLNEVLREAYLSPQGNWKVPEDPMPFQELLTCSSVNPLSMDLKNLAVRVKLSDSPDEDSSWRDASLRTISLESWLHPQDTCFV